MAATRPGKERAQCEVCVFFLLGGLMLAALTCFELFVIRASEHGPAVEVGWRQHAHRPCAVRCALRGPAHTMTTQVHSGTRRSSPHLERVVCVGTGQPGARERLFGLPGVSSA